MARLPHDKLLLFGSEGNMGKRYAAILNHLRVPFIPIDIKRGNYNLSSHPIIRCSTKLIVAVPTHKHIEVLNFIATARAGAAVPEAHVLCEKPVTTTEGDLNKLAANELTGRLKVFSVNNYAHHYQYSVFSTSEGRTYYNYYKHGDDGLAWDCFQLFAMAKGSVILNEISPLWKCKINGTPIDVGGMDLSYVNMVSDFLGPMARVWGIDSIEAATRKVLKWIQDDDLENQSQS